ncbi:hypothetical protein V6Z11_A05G464600 [Gossypium hirsutum]
MNFHMYFMRWRGSTLVFGEECFGCREILDWLWWNKKNLMEHASGDTETLSSQC